MPDEISNLPIRDERFPLPVPFGQEKLVNLRTAEIDWKAWRDVWDHDPLPSHISENFGNTFSITEFKAANPDRKDMYSIGLYDREPGGREIHVAKDGSRGVILYKKYGHMGLFHFDLHPEEHKKFIANLLDFINKTGLTYSMNPKMAEVSHNGERPAVPQPAPASTTPTR